MEYGHHNHNYNFQEHHLVRRPRLDIYPGAARRIYIDVAVPADAPPGNYRGELRVLDAGGTTLATVPLELEVLPLTLRDAADLLRHRQRAAERPRAWRTCESTASTSSAAITTRR